LENVARLPGNSAKIVEEHYGAWVQSRRDALEKEIEKAWKSAKAGLLGLFNQARKCLGGCREAGEVSVEKEWSVRIGCGKSDPHRSA
jgi:hypothetical protein